MERALTPAENRIVEMLKTVEDYFDRRKLSVKLEVTENQLKKFREGGCEAMRYEFDSKTNKYTILITTLMYYKYIKHAATMTGMTLFEDGSLLTYDNLIIANDYLRNK